MSNSSAVTKQALQLHNDMQESLKSFQSIAPAALKTSDYSRVLTSIMAATTKTVNIIVSEEDLTTLKDGKYNLCFAKKVGDAAYNVVWSSSSRYLHKNQFRWMPRYQVFGTNTFKGGVTVTATTKRVPIGLGERVTLNPQGTMGNPATGGPEDSITLINDYGPIHPGVNQTFIDLDGDENTTPIYVAERQVVPGEIVLTPVEKVLVWFEQDIQTSTMFSSARSRAVEIDLTFANEATRYYEDNKWITR